MVVPLPYQRHDCVSEKGKVRWHYRLQNDFRSIALRDVRHWY